MKKILFIISASALMFSCNNVADGEFVLTGSVDGIADGKNVILEKNDDSLGIVPIDTVKLKNGKFRFEGKILEPSMHSITIETVQTPSYVILESGEIDIKINKDSVFTNKLSGTYNNEQLTEFNAGGMKLQKKIKAFEVENQPTLNAARQAKDTATLRELQEKYAVLQKEMQESTVKYIEQHPKAYISSLLILSMFNTFEPEVPRITKLYNALAPEVKSTKIGAKIKKKLADIKVADIGRKAPDFSAPNPEGKVISLKESMGKLTIIDFWASWCGPCRAENPNIVAIYKDYHDKGLNIVSVSLDKPGEAAKWKEAIAKDGLTWTQVSNLKQWDDPIAKTYGVEAIPKMFLVNEKGIVVAKDLRGEQLRAKVREFLDHTK